MDHALQTILHEPHMLGREGQYVVLDELVRNGDLATIVARLPPCDRLRLFVFLMNDDNIAVRELSPTVFYNVISCLGAALNLSEPGIFHAALELATGKSQMRSLRDIPRENPKSFDGLQNYPERGRQIYLACVITNFLPAARTETPEQFVKTQLSDRQQGAIWAYMHAERVQADAFVTAARDLIARTVTMTPGVWAGFCIAAQNVANTTATYAKPLIKLIDEIVERDIMSLTPETIRELDQQKAFYYLEAMCWAGEKSQSFRKMQRYFFKHLPPTPALKLLRERQIDKAIHSFSHLPSAEINAWQQAKKS